jgi:hypothetical protein
VCSLFLASCSQPIQPTPTVTQTIRTEIPTVKSLTTITPVPKAAIPDTPMPTMTVPPTQSPTPLATLSPQAARIEIAKLMATNNGCSGPCFWGITPGVTNFDQAIRELKPLKDKALEETKDNYKVGYQYREDQITISLAISGSNDKIQSLNATVVGLGLPDITGKDWLAFRPDSFLKANGIPKQVKVIMSEGPEGRVSYGMALLYDEMLITYNGNQIIIKPENILHACPIADQNIQRFDLRLGQYDENTWNGWIDLTQITPLTVNEFYQILVGDSKTACFDLDYQRFLAGR